MSELQTGGVTVGDLYRVLVDMQGTMSRLTAHIERIDGRNTTADQLHSDHEARLRVLERFRYTLGGLAVFGGLVAGIVGEYIGQHLH